MSQFGARRTIRIFARLGMLACVLLFSVSAKCAQATQQRNLVASRDVIRLAQHLDSFVPRRMHELGIPGVAVALVDHGEVVWAKGYGVADKATGTPVTPETVFQAASISKSVTAWGVIRLVQEGKLALDAPAERYLTRWHLPPSKYDNSGVTIRRLLSHTAGLSTRGYLGSEPTPLLPTLEQSLSGETEPDGNVHVEIQPGTRFSYSGGGYTLLQLIVEEVTHEKFSDYMWREVLQPLGMEHSSFEWTPDVQALAARSFDQFGNRLPNYVYTAKAAAGLYTTAFDLARFVAAGMRGPNGELVGRGVVMPLMFLQMTTAAPATNGAYGLGFQIQRLPGGLHMVFHPGGNRGWGAVFAELPEKSDGVVVLTNSDSGEVLATQVAVILAAHPLYRSILWMAEGLGILLVLLVGWVWLRLGSGRRRWGWGAAKPGPLKIGCIMALALIASVWWLSWYSDLLARAIVGLKGVVPADEMPSTFRWLTVAVTLWCLAGIVNCLTSRIVGLVEAV